MRCARVCANLVWSELPPPPFDVAAPAVLAKNSRHFAILYPDSVKTHTQTEMAAIRQKLLRKISKQGQLSKPHENFAVIELNDVSIAGDFAVLSSLSGGSKMNLGLESGKVLSRGYDWDNSVFDDPSTQWLRESSTSACASMNREDSFSIPSSPKARSRLRRTYQAKFFNVFDGFRSQGKHSSPGRRISSSK